MKLNAYSIFDSASGLYSRPFFDTADAVAKRSFGQIAQDAEHPIGAHPDDYTLFRIGMWDDTNGKLTDENNESMCTALEEIAKTRTIDRSQMEFLNNGLDLDPENQPSPGGTI